VGAVGVAGVLALGAYAYTASNTVPASRAGTGSGAITGYTVSSITYTINGTTPTNLDGVGFSISPTAAATVKAQLASGGAWYSCVNTSGSVACDTTSPQATVAAATQLTVVAAD
jgi:hypothetical protein